VVVRGRRRSSSQSSNVESPRLLLAPGTPIRCHMRMGMEPPHGCKGRCATDFKTASLRSSSFADLRVGGISGCRGLKAFMLVHERSPVLASKLASEDKQ
jgi:hypothetical protein